MRSRKLFRTIARAQLAALAAAALTGCARPDDGTQRVRVGAEVLLRDRLDLVRGQRVGLVTNHTGVIPEGDTTRSVIDALHAHPEVELVALYSPEHGIRGAIEGGERVADDTDPATGLPIHSLYGETRIPTPAMLAGVDVLLFDIQDIGARYYTYVWTMAHAMEAAAREGIPFVVLDRPDPIDGLHVQGNVQDHEWRTFVGLYPVPMRHGLTAGELARLVNGEHDVGARLTVVPMAGWHRTAWYDDTGLPWTAPSPNMPSLESATHYPGTCLFEGTNLSVGRGTPIAFQQIGAPWLDHDAVAAALNGRGLRGVRFEAVTFTPDAPGDGKFDGVSVNGVRFVTTDRTVYDPTRAAVAALVAIRARHARELEWREAHFDRLAGTESLRRAILAGADVEEATAGWAEQAASFEALRRDYLLYGSDPDYAALEDSLRDVIEAAAPHEVAVAFRDLGTGVYLGIGDTVTMHAASTMKVPVLLELFRQAEAGRFDLDDRVTVKNEFTSIADGSTYSLSVGDDSDDVLYGKIGGEATYRELARLMIVRSSNLATNNLVEIVDADSAAALMARIGADGMQVLRGVEDIPAFRAGMSNRTTARALARVLEAIQRCEVTSRAACNAMIEILKGQEFNDKIPAGLPPGTPVAHKTGRITGIDHDGAIVYPPDREPYVLVVLTRGFQDDRDAAKAVAAEISRLVWQALTSGR